MILSLLLLSSLSLSLQSSLLYILSVTKYCHCQSVSPSLLSLTTISRETLVSIVTVTVIVGAVGDKILSLSLLSAGDTATVATVCDTAFCVITDFVFF